MQPLTWRRSGRRPRSAAAVPWPSSRPPPRRSPPWWPARWPRAPRSGWSGCSLACWSAPACSTPPGAPRSPGSSVAPRAGCAPTCCTPRCSQPLPVLEELAVGEVLDRVDDDARQVGVSCCGAPGGSWAAPCCARCWPGWSPGSRGGRRGSGSRWWGCSPWSLVRPLTRVVADRKLAEEAAWSDHSAQLEEAIAGRDDVRSSLGQPHVVRQYVRLAQQVLRRVAATCAASTQVGLRTGLVVHAALAALAVSGAALVGAGRLGVAGLVTLWLLVTTFAGQLNQVTDRLPEVQAGLGALQRIGSLLVGAAGARGRRARAGRPGRGGVPRPDRRLPRRLRPALGRPRRSRRARPARSSGAPAPASRHWPSCCRGRWSRRPATVFVAGQDVTDDGDRGPAARGRRRHAAHRDPRRHARGEHHAVQGRPARRASRVPSTRSGSTDWVASLPQGLGTRLGTGGSTLSAGEEQLVAFARLLVRDVAVVVLDEATARMDPQTERLVTRAADRLLAGRTGIVIAHRLSTTRRCDSVAVLDRGRVVQQGPRARLADRARAVPRPAGRLRRDRACRRRRGPWSAAASAGTARRHLPRRSPPGLTRTVSARCCARIRAGVWSVRSGSSPPRCWVATARSPAGCGAWWSPPWSRAPTPWAAAGAPHGVAAVGPGGHRAGLPHLPAVVGGGDAADAACRAARADDAASARPHPAGGGRRPRARLGPAGDLRRPMGRRDQRGRSSCRSPPSSGRACWPVR